MTPEPIVATVRFESGDMRASIGVPGGPRRPAPRGIARYGGTLQAIPPVKPVHDRREPVVEGGDDRLCDLVFAREGGRRRKEEELMPIFVIRAE
jgi:hypothetical protein